MSLVSAFDELDRQYRAEVDTLEKENRQLGQRIDKLVRGLELAIERLEMNNYEGSEARFIRRLEKLVQEART